MFLSMSFLQISRLLVVAACHSRSGGAICDNFTVDGKAGLGGSQE